MRRGALAGRSVLSAADLDRDEQDAVLALALRLRDDPGAAGTAAPGGAVALIFDKPSLRTKSSFAVGAARLGLTAVPFTRDEVDLGRRESMEDGARVLSRYFTALVHRTFEHERVERLAAAASVPVVNALTDHEHPCQALADLLTMRQVFGRLEGLEIAWVGDGNNVLHSLVLAAAAADVHVRIAAPDGHHPDPAVLERARARGGSVELVDSPTRAVAGAHVVTTDTWVSMGQESEAEERRRIFEPYRVDAALMAQARPEAIFLHCLPAHRGDEVTDEVMDGPQSRILDEAENRLHAQQALLALLLDLA